MAMKKLGVEEIKKIIRPCGLSNKKSSAIHLLSEILLKDFSGEVPPNLADLEKLPGVGHKTASVVLAQGFHVPTFPVDTHIHRLAFRWKISNGKNVVQSELDLKKTFPKKFWNDLHLQMIYYGREFCPARSHDLDKCIICRKINEL